MHRGRLTLEAVEELRQALDAGVMDTKKILLQMTLLAPRHQLKVPLQPCMSSGEIMHR